MGIGSIGCSLVWVIDCWYYALVSEPAKWDLGNKYENRAGRLLISRMLYNWELAPLWYDGSSIRDTQGNSFSKCAIFHVRISRHSKTWTWNNLKCWADADTLRFGMLTLRISVFQILFWVFQKFSDLKNSQVVHFKTFQDARAFKDFQDVFQFESFQA